MFATDRAMFDYQQIIRGIALWAVSKFTHSPFYIKYENVRYTPSPKSPPPLGPPHWGGNWGGETGGDF